MRFDMPSQLEFKDQKRADEIFFGIKESNYNFPFGKIVYALSRLWVNLTGKTSNFQTLKIDDNEIHIALACFLENPNWTKSHNQLADSFFETKCSSIIDKEDLNGPLGNLIDKICKKGTPIIFNELLKALPENAKFDPDRALKTAIVNSNLELVTLFLDDKQFDDKQFDGKLNFELALANAANLKDTTILKKILDSLNPSADSIVNILKSRNCSIEGLVVLIDKISTLRNQDPSVSADEAQAILRQQLLSRMVIKRDLEEFKTFVDVPAIKSVMTVDFVQSLYREATEELKKNKEKLESEQLKVVKQQEKRWDYIFDVSGFTVDSFREARNRFYFCQAYFCILFPSEARDTLSILCTEKSEMKPYSDEQCSESYQNSPYLEIVLKHPNVQKYLRENKEFKDNITKKIGLEIPALNLLIEKECDPKTKENLKEYLQNINTLIVSRFLPNTLSNRHILHLHDYTKTLEILNSI